MISLRFEIVTSPEDTVAASLSVARRKSGTLLTPRLPLSFLGVLALLCLAGAPPAHAQAASEYGSAASVSAAVSSRPKVFTPGGVGKPNMGLFLAKPEGTPPEALNRQWFEKQAGKDGGLLTITAVPPRTRLWIDGKYVGQAPVTITLPAGKHQLSLLGPRQETAKRDLEIKPKEKQHLAVDLQELYPSAVAIQVFGKQPH
jgi:hypothetical protein